jgi:hypothetical protein
MIPLERDTVCTLTRGDVVLIVAARNAILAVPGARRA